MSLKFRLNIDSVVIDESLSLKISAQDLQDALSTHFQTALREQGAAGVHSLQHTSVEAPALRSAEGLSEAITASVFSDAEPT
jgi:hypothetical protein